MSFIDKFLDVTANLPRKIIRILKLIKFVEERSKNKNDELNKLRNKYIKNLKENNSNNEEKDILNLNKEYLKELINLSEYKLKLIDELKYILEEDFIKKLNPIVEEGQNELKEEMNSTNGNNNSNYNKITEDKSISIIPEKIKKPEKLLGNKTKRPNQNINRKKNVGNIEYYEENGQIGEEDNQTYCICNQPSFGKMIECDSCMNWFHYKCVGMNDNDEEPASWLCAECKAKMENSNINNSTNITNNRTKKKEKSSKKKKYNQK